MTYIAQSPFITKGYWLGVKDGDMRAFALYQRHYSYKAYRDQRRRNGLMMGPGEKLLLLTYNCDAIFGWRKFKDDSGQRGINCNIFRNESPIKSSVLIEEAVEIAWQRWPGERLYTYINPRAVRSSNPGYCFLKAGWKKCGITKWNKLLIMERQP